MRNLISILLYLSTRINNADLQIRSAPNYIKYSYGGQQMLLCKTAKSNKYDGFYNTRGTRLATGVSPPNKFHLVYREGHYVLTIYQMVIGDEGEYMCRRGIMWDIFHFYYEDSFGPIVSPQTLVIGVSNIINVTVYNKGPPYIEWLKFKKPVSKFVRIAPPPTTGDDSKYSIVNNQLVINNMDKTDSGTYKMTIRQERGRSSTKTLEIIVKEYSETITTRTVATTTTTTVPKTTQVKKITSKPTTIPSETIQNLTSSINKNKNATSTKNSFSKLLTKVKLFFGLSNDVFIIAGAGAGTIVLIIALLTLCWCRRRKRIQQKDNMMRVRDKPIKKHKNKSRSDKEKILKKRKIQKNLLGGNEDFNDAYQFLNKDICLKTVRSQLRPDTKRQANLEAVTAETANEFQKIRSTLKRKKENRADKEEGEKTERSSCPKKKQESIVLKEAFGADNTDLENNKLSPFKKKRSSKPRVLNSTTEKKTSSQEQSKLLKDENTTKARKSREILSTDSNDLESGKASSVRKKRSSRPKTLDSTTQEPSKLKKDPHRAKIVKEVDLSVKREKNPKKRKKIRETQTIFN